ncbi:MAG: hypothetical protein ABI165_07055 [Bryobacteraceae bacterium]
MLTTSSWKSYIGGQGTILFSFLLIGGFLAWIAFYVGPHPGTVTQGKLIAYHVDPSKGVLIEDQDAQNYHHITILSQTATPSDGSAILTVYGESPNVGKHEIGRIETNASACSRWEQQNSSQHLTMTIATGAGIHPATMVDVFVFLSPE